MSEETKIKALKAEVAALKVKLAETESALGVIRRREFANAEGIAKAEVLGKEVEFLRSMVRDTAKNQATAVLSAVTAAGMPIPEVAPVSGNGYPWR